MRTRAERRQLAELQKRRARHFHVVAGHLDPRHVGRAATSPRPCSCWKCGGNPRRFFGEPTLQERRAEERRGWGEVMTA